MAFSPGTFFKKKYPHLLKNVVTLLFKSERKGNRRKACPGKGKFLKIRKSF